MMTLMEMAMMIKNKGKHDNTKKKNKQLNSKSNLLVGKNTYKDYRVNWILIKGEQ